MSGRASMRGGIAGKLPRGSGVGGAVEAAICNGGRGGRPNPQPANDDMGAIDCVALYIDKGGHCRCSALKDLFCVREPLEQCQFQLTHDGAALGRSRRAMAPFLQM